ncbi:MAG: peptidoglycan synthetase, partial [Adhaeribacter sp.]|nr:peptidoglycan synthetase [Adhaeribacter sp.]
FLPQYQHALNEADVAIVYFNPKTLEHKRMPALSASDITAAFGNEQVQVFTDSQALADYLKMQSWENRNLLLMSSGTFNNLDLNELTASILHV